MKPIRIRYCRVWNYRPRAVRVAAVIKEALGVETELEEGARGEFSVWVGKALVSEKGPDGFPSEEDALAAVKQALGRHWPSAHPLASTVSPAAYWAP